MLFVRAGCSGTAWFSTLCTSSHCCLRTGAYVVFVKQLHKLRARQIKDLPVPKCLTAGGCLEMMDAIVAAGTRALHGLMVTSRRAYMHRLSYTWDCPKQVQCLVTAAPTSVPSLAFSVDLPQHVYTVRSAGMSRLIPKSPPSPPCLFTNHLIKEMSAPKPYPACSPYSQRFFSAKSGSFASGISQHTSKISIHECISLH